MVEIERRFLVGEPPGDLPPGDELRQGYIAIDQYVTVRVRDTGGHCVLTVKGGRGLARTEVEVDVDIDRFDALWPLTEGRRIHKTRHRLPLGPDVVELDVFADALDGLLIAEVEFDSESDAEAFVPPSWFGVEVTHDPSWNNASLSTHGRPDRGTDGPTDSPG